MGNFFDDVIRNDPRLHTKKSVTDKALLEPKTRAAVDAIIADAAARGVKLMAWETFRSKERQQVLFDQGKTQRKEVGVHHYGLACDIVRDKNGQPSWDGDFSVVGELAKKHGLIWGGDWGNPGVKPSLFDPVHVQRCRVSDQKKLFAGTWYPDHDYDPTAPQPAAALEEGPELDAVAQEDEVYETGAPFFRFATAEVLSTVPADLLRLLVVRDAGAPLPAAEDDDGPDLRREAAQLQDQFVMFQFNRAREGKTILESSSVEPVVEGSAELPDVRASLELLSFNVGANENIDRDTKATMRINFGKDPASADRVFETVSWAVAAGLDLYDQTRRTRTAGRDLRADLGGAFPQRPIEIPGGLARFSFEVVKHREPSWWRKIFSSLTGATAQRLVSVLGFPAITNDAIKLLDELLNRLDRNDAEVLFSSQPARLALTRRAKADFMAGSERVRVAGLAPGYCILARGRDFATIADANAEYYSQYEKLVPAGVSEADLLAGRYDDPFANVTYAMFRVRMSSTKLHPTLEL